MSEVRYEGFADWYDREFATSELGASSRRAVIRLLGPGEGGLIDVGCGGGSHAVAFGELGCSIEAARNGEQCEACQ